MGPVKHKVLYNANQLTGGPFQTVDFIISKISGKLNKVVGSPTIIEWDKILNWETFRSQQKKNWIAIGIEMPNDCLVGLNRNVKSMCVECKILNAKFSYVIINYHNDSGLRPFPMEYTER